MAFQLKKKKKKKKGLWVNQNQKCGQEMIFSYYYVFFMINTMQMFSHLFLCSFLKPFIPIINALYNETEVSEENDWGKM